MNIFILTASPFFGGPERQMTGLAETLRRLHPDVRSIIASFSEKGNARPFLEKAAAAGFETIELQNDFPHLLRAKKELQTILQERQIDLILANGHKARCVAWLAAKSGRIPVVGVSRGWTDENFKIRLYNRFDLFLLRRMQHIISVSDGQAEKMKRLGIPGDRVTVIRNAIRTDRFDEKPDTSFRQTLEAMFPVKPRFLLGAAGRLSPEKGYDVLIEAMRRLSERNISAGLVIFGDGFLRETLEKQAESFGVQNMVRLPGFTGDLDRFLPNFDLFVQSSYTEGLPNVLLESMAAQTAVVATRVGGTPEVVEEGVTGLMVAPKNANELAAAIAKLLENPERLADMGVAGKKRVERLFTFDIQAEQYYELFRRYVGTHEAGGGRHEAGGKRGLQSPDAGGGRVEFSTFLDEFTARFDDFTQKSRIRD